MEENTEEMNLSKTGSAVCYEEIVRMRALGVGHLASTAVAFVQDEDSSSGTDEEPEHTAMALGITTLEKLYSAITQGDTPLHSGRESHPITPTLFTNILKEENDIWG
ncbi:uncharacterized protein [Littorina saxatilis]|uniref:uncharacterized protein n=1 Tax=Littorina saxatilis TaxID=31220 RepID=UPI0038B6A17F